MGLPKIETHHFGDDQRNNPSSKQSVRIYELAVGFVLVYSVVGFIVWQRLSQRMSDMEAKLGEIQLQVVSSETETIPTGLSIHADHAKIMVTKHFRFIFRSSHTRIVNSVAESSDSAYVQLRRSLGLTQPINGPKITILIGDVEAETTTTSDRDMPHILRLDWPSAASDKPDTEKVEWLKNELLAVLSNVAFEEALHGREIKDGWLMFAKAIENYLQQPSAEQPNTAQALSSHLSFDPAAISPSGTLIEQSHLEPLQSYTLIDFILTEYGDEIIPTLLDAFTQHEGWDTLTPAVFNLSADEFEAAWHDYLEQTYPQRSTEPGN